MLDRNYQRGLLKAAVLVSNLKKTLQPLLFWKKAGKPTKNARVFLFAETPKILGKGTKNAQKSKGNRKTEKSKENEKSKDWRVRVAIFIEFFRGRPRAGDNFTSLFQVLPTLDSKRQKHPF